MNNVFASAQRPVVVADGAGHIGRFLTIWVGAGGDGDIAVSEDGGNTFTVYPGVPGGAFFSAFGSAIGTAAQGTSATSLVAASWGPK